MNLQPSTKHSPRHEQKVLTDAEILLETFGLRSCLIVDEKRQIISAATRESATFLQRLAEVAPTMALLPECRSLHTDYLRQEKPELEEEEISCSRFDIAGRRFFLCAHGPKCAEKEKELLRALLSGIQ